MKLTKKYLRKLIKETITEVEDSREFELRLTQKQANLLLLALENYAGYERGPEALELYDIILDAGIDANFGSEDPDQGEEPDSEDEYSAEDAERDKWEAESRRRY